MENINIIEVPNQAGEMVEHVVIDKGNGELTSMLKSVWDAQQEAAELGGTL